MSFTAVQRGKAGIGLFAVTALLGAVLYAAFYLNGIYREKEREIEKLNEVVKRLESANRVAQVIVKEQGRDRETGRLRTTVKFMELDRNERPLAPRYFTVEGDVLYFDALVIQFEHDYVERGEALRGKSIALFRRVFGETQPPEEGFPIDGSEEERAVPDVYRVDPDPDPFEIDLWEHFWEYAADPEAARQKGVRVIQGEAVYTRFVPENIYNLTLDHDGGISIQVVPMPAILRGEMKSED